MGPLVSEQQLRRVTDLVGDVGGLPLDLPGYKPVDGGYFYRPAIVVEYDFEGRFAREEIFGPVMSVRAFDGDDEAYRLANDTDYGLAASVWTASLARSEQARRRLQAGIVWINCVHALSAGTPVSGHKASGMGIEYGLEVVEQYMRVKTTVTMHGGWESPFA